MVQSGRYKLPSADQRGVSFLVRSSPRAGSLVSAFCLAGLLAALTGHALRGDALARRRRRPDRW